MITYQVGNLFSVSTPRIIAHGCNAQGKMGKGFARTLRFVYPKNYLHYLQCFNDPDGLKLGDALFCVQGCVHIANLITQEFYGQQSDTRYISYEALAKTFEKLKRYHEVNPLEIHMPMIGHGLAGGELCELIKIYHDSLYGLPVIIWVSNVQTLERIRDECKRSGRDGHARFCQ